MDSLILYSTEHEKMRLGRRNDGGYVICKLPGSYDLFISGGISGDISFEQNFLDVYYKQSTRTPHCFAFDGTIDRMPVTVPDERMTFVKKNLGDPRISGDCVTNLHDYISGHSDVFMKIDIEGHEFRLLPTLIEKLNHLDRSMIQNIKQLVVEIHSPGDIQLHPTYFQGLSDITHDFMFKMLERLNETHTLVHLHANNGCKTHIVNAGEKGDVVLPNVFECTFIRNDFVKTKTRNNESLPTVHDMKNIPSLPDYSFSGYPFTA